MSLFNTPVSVETAEPVAATRAGDGVTVSATKSASSSASVRVAVAASDDTSTRPPVTVGVALAVTVLSGSATELFTLDKVKVAVFAVVPSPAANDSEDGEGVAVTPSGRFSDKTTGTAAAPGSRSALRVTSIVTAPATASSSRLDNKSPAESFNAICTSTLSRTVTVAEPDEPTVASRGSELVMRTVKVSASSFSPPCTSGISIVVVRLPAGIVKVVSRGTR